MARSISPTFLVITLLCVLAFFAPLAALTWRQNEGGKIVGRVIERDTGRPLAAEIGITIRSRRGITVEHINVSEHGQFEVAGLPPGETHLTTKLAGYAVEHHSLSLSEGEMRQIGFRLIKAGIVRGIVHDPEGNPVADAQIRVVYADESSPHGAVAATYQWELGEVRSATAGGFTIEVHPEKEFIIEASHPGFIGEVSSPMRLASTENRPLLRLPLSRGVSFQGEVKDENGAPIAGAQARLMETEERPELQRFASFELLKQRARTAVSGADGKFRFDQVRSAQKALVITHPKFQSITRAVEPASYQELAPTVMTPKGKNER